MQLRTYTFKYKMQQGSRDNGSYFFVSIGHRYRIIKMIANVCMKWLVLMTCGELKFSAVMRGGLYCLWPTFSEVEWCIQPEAFLNFAAGAPPLSLSPWNTNRKSEETRLDQECIMLIFLLFRHHTHSNRAQKFDDTG